MKILTERWVFSIYFIQSAAIKKSELGLVVNREEVKKITKATIIDSISGFAEKSLKKKAKFQILDLIIPRERKIRSIVGGMETSLGTTLWEPLGKALAEGNGFVVHNKNLECPSNMPAGLSNTLQAILEDRYKDGGLYNAQSSHDEIRRVCQTFIARPIQQFEPAPTGKGVDIWLERDGIHYFFDTKTVQPNIGTLSGCLAQLLGWYAFFYSRNPTGNAVSRIVFPYNPNAPETFWDGAMNKGKPLEADNEGWVEDQFWDFCSGYIGTYELITECFTEIRDSKELEKVLDKLLK